VGDSIVDYVRRRIVIYAAAFAIFVLGIVAGQIAADGMDGRVREELSAFLGGYVSDLAGATPGPFGEPGAVSREVLRGAGIPWILGMTVIGAPLALALVFMRGFALGFSIGFLFDRLAYKGILLAFAGILPHALFQVPGLVLASGSAIAFSLAAAKALAGRRGEGPVLAHFAVSSVLIGGAALLLAAGAWVQANLSPILAQQVARYAAITL